jgi:hypothetical protein
MRPFNIASLSALLALAAFFLPSPAAASVREKLREQIKPLAQKLLLIMKEEEQTNIDVGEFSGKDDVAFGPGFQELLSEELNAIQAGVISAKSPLSVRGDYDLVDDPEGRAEKLKVIRLSLRIVKSTGEIIGKLAREIERPTLIKDSEVIAVVLAPPTPLPPAETREQLNRRIQDAKEAPSFHSDGTHLRNMADSPFAIELLATTKDQTPADYVGWTKVPSRRVEKLPGGLPFVDVKRDEVYAVRVFNGTKNEAAVTLSIDGLDVFSFSEVRTPEGRPKYGHFILAPESETIITGWHKTNDRADSFLVTEFGKGAISKLSNPNRGKVGVVTATFALSWEGDNVPEAEKGTRNASGNETGFGPPTKTDIQEVKRKIGVVREVLSVRYTH